MYMKMNYKTMSIYSVMQKINAQIMLILFGVCAAFTSCSSSDDSQPPGPEPGSPAVTERNYYVSPHGNDDNSGLSSSTPFKTIAKSLERLRPGDVVNLMNGTYETTSGPILSMDKKYSGTADKYITIKAMDGHKPIIKANGDVWNTVEIGASYVILDGLELEGANQVLSYNDAYKIYEDYIADNKGGDFWQRAARHNTNGIQIGTVNIGGTNVKQYPHHVIVRNCIVHDFPGGGIGSSDSDYITIENNIVYNNSWYTMYACSGISIINPHNSDSETGYKMIISGNYCHSNRTEIPWGRTKALSDGNGIIIDVNQGAQVNDPQDEPTPPYKGRTLVKNNISVNNGGSGIHSFKADHVDIFHNTAYNNGRKVGYADIHSNQCKDVNIKNNIMYANVDNPCNEKPGDPTVAYDYNIYYGGTVKYEGPNDIVADPQFVNLSLDRLAADFHLKEGSPAKGSGFEGKNRGAYE